MYYFFYNLITGQITQKGFSIAEPITPNGFGIIELEDRDYQSFDQSFYYINVIDLSLTKKPQKPEGDCFFNYDTKQWVQDQALTIGKNKSKRNELLAQSDWTQGNDSPLSNEVMVAWSKYRQELRDMTEQDYLDGSFPVMPS